MKRDEARSIVRECLEFGYDSAKFNRLIANLLTGECNFFEKIVGESYVRHAFKDFVSSYVIKGSYEDPEWKRIAILEVRLKNASNLFNARTMQRNFVADFLKSGSLGRQDGALVAYTIPGSDDWRFSFVKMEYSLDIVDGKVKTSEEITPAKRWSFLVGKHEKSHTAQARLSPLVAEESHPATFREIEQAFDVEKVTDEFFEKYKELFFRLKEEMENLVLSDSGLASNFEAIGLLDKSLEDGKSLGIANLAKKTLGQIAFLYFLQKKGWFGVAPDKKWWEGPKNFLRLLFERREKYGANFFNDILEPLFYEALATDRGEAAFYTRLNNCRIPFLNGGLFEPMKGYDWERTNLAISDVLFSNSNKTKEGDVGDGILDVFDRYNFTVSEDEPLEKEVAVDPEMLGKIFENLLEINDRKSKGAFYTPRPIVHYMCQESLIEYILSKVPEVPRKDLETLIRESEAIIENDRTTKGKILEKKARWFDYIGEYKFKTPETIIENALKIDFALERVRIVDPAVGSGAFPLWLINEIVKARQIVQIHLENGVSSYDLKLHAIQHSIYGVDLDPGAVEICQLRLWLSLVVDETEPHPLPNLDYRIMQGNSLVEEYDGIRLYDARLLEKSDGRLRGEQITFDSYSGNFSESERLYQKLQSSLERFVKTSARTEKKELKKSIDALKWSLIETTLIEQWRVGKLEEIKKLRDSNITPFFLWKLEFSEVFQENGGFDIVIGNPPYIGEKGHKEIFRSIAQGNLGKYYQGKMDLFYFFFHLAIDIARTRAQIAFITTDYYVTAHGAIKLRNDIKNRTVVKQLIDFNDLKIFESALWQHNMITLLQKVEWAPQVIAETCLVLPTNWSRSVDISLESVLARNTEGLLVAEVPQHDLFEGEEAYIRLRGNGADDPTSRLLLKIKLKSDCLLDSILNMHMGIQSSADYVSNGNYWILKNTQWISVGDWIFILSKQELQGLTLSEKESRIIKRTYKNSSVSRWILNLGRHENDEIYHIFSNAIDNESDYPALISHLSKFKDILVNRAQFEGHCNHWWDLHQPRIYNRPLNEISFEKEKIVISKRSKGNNFAYSSERYYEQSDIMVITIKDNVDFNIKYILAFLNSKLFLFWYQNKWKRKGGIYEFYGKPMSEVPIKKPLDQSQFVMVVNELIDLLKTPSPNRSLIRELESRIDVLIYRLYELTPDEIDLVEKSTI